jgi:subtilisin family serine protease
MNRQISTALLAVLLTLSAGPAAAALSVPRLPGAAETVPGELIVKFKPGTGSQGRAAALAATGHSTISTLGGLGAEGWVHVRVAPGQTDAQALAAYAGNPNVEFAQPNYIYRASAVPNDPGYPLQWGWKNNGFALTSVPTQPSGGAVPWTTNNPGTAGSDMNLEKAWDKITDCSSVLVAVLDTGINYTHTELASNMWTGGGAYPGKNFADDVLPSTDPIDLAGHGTHVAGTIGAVGNNGAGVTGVCWKAKIMAVRVLGADGSGSSAGIIQGIDFAVTNGAKVLNMSLGGNLPLGTAPDALYAAAIARAEAADVVVVVAAGNDGHDNEAKPGFPCNFTNKNVLCVAALDQAFGLASFSNWGATSVDVGAPGTNIVSTWNGPVVNVPITTGWTFTTTTTGGGWGYHVFTGNGGSTINGLTGPSGFGSVTYKNSTNDKAYINYDMSSVSRAVLKFSAAWDLGVGDSFNIAAHTGGGEPFTLGTVAGTTGGQNTNWNEPSLFDSLALDITPCVSASCTFGFQLVTDNVTDNPLRYGVAIVDVSLATVRSPGADYHTENGTSMATPAVAGLATMLRAWHGPSFTATDVIGAIKGGGRATASLAGKTTSGRAADAMGALAYINAPTGVTAAVR